MTEKGFSIKVDSRIKHTFCHRKPRYLYGLLKKLRFAALVPLARNDSPFSVIARHCASKAWRSIYYQHLEFLRIDIFDDFFCDVAHLLCDVISVVGNGGILLCGAFNLRDRLIDLC